MKRLVVDLFSLALVLAVLPALSAAEPARSVSDLDRARELVRLLGSEDFKVREDATHRLTVLGKTVDPALKEGLAGEDAEVRRRCSDLLELSGRSELETTLAEFLVDHDEKVLQKLPAYPRFLKVVGDQPEARTLFVDMCLTDAALLITAEKDPAAAAAAIQARCEQQQQKMRFGLQPQPLGQVAVLLYVAADERVPLAVAHLNMMCNALYQQDARTAFEKNPAARKLLLHFLERPTEANFVYQKLNLIQIHNLKESMPWALKLAQDKAQPAYVRAQALALVGRLGTKENIADIEALLSDTTELGKMQFNQTSIQTQMGDVALGTLILLSGQRLEEYEFPYFREFPQVLNQQQRNPNGFFLPYHCLGFGNDNARAIALKKYKDAMTAAKK